MTGNSAGKTHRAATVSLGVIALVVAVSVTLAAVASRRTATGATASLQKNTSSLPAVLHAGTPQFPRVLGGPTVDMFYLPRVIAIAGNGEIFVMDKWGKMFVFNATGELKRFWMMPDRVKGMPEGITFDRTGRVLVADTHYSRVIFFTQGGKPLPELTFGRDGSGPGEFCYPSSIVTDKASGRIFVGEYGRRDRVQVFSEAGKFLYQIGKRGADPGHFNRVTSLAISRDGTLFVCDAANHRIQAMTRAGGYLYEIGGLGTAPGRLRYPYDIKIWSRNNRSPEYLFVCEYGNNRVQAFTLSGQSLGTAGGPGEAPGRLKSPWALAVTADGQLMVTDTGNHRLQNFGSVDTLFNLSNIPNGSPGDEPVGNSKRDTAR